jgi:hypothetical protein
MSGQCQSYQAKGIDGWGEELTDANPTLDVEEALSLKLVGSEDGLSESLALLGHGVCDRVKWGVGREKVWEGKMGVGEGRERMSCRSDAEFDRR